MNKKKQLSVIYASRRRAFQPIYIKQFRAKNRIG